MKFFRFDPDVGQMIGQFDSVKVVLSKVIHLDDEAVINCIYVRPNGKIGYHQAAAQQLFLLVEGEGWVRGTSDEKLAVMKGQAVLWEKDEWHESGKKTGLTAVIIEGVDVDPSDLMPSIQEYEL